MPRLNREWIEGRIRGERAEMLAMIRAGRAKDAEVRRREIDWLLDYYLQLGKVTSDAVS